MSSLSDWLRSSSTEILVMMLLTRALCQDSGWYCAVVCQPCVRYDPCPAAV